MIPWSPLNSFTISVVSSVLQTSAALSRILGAELDVLTDEHINSASFSHPLIEYAKTHDNLILTPHVGGATYESMYKTEIFMANKLSNWIKSNTGSD